jgi:hypothetical protein
VTGEPEGRRTSFGSQTQDGSTFISRMLIEPILDFGLEEGLIVSPPTTGSLLNYLLLFFPNLKSKIQNPKLSDCCDDTQISASECVGVSGFICQSYP